MISRRRSVLVVCLVLSFAWLCSPVSPGQEVKKEIPPRDLSAYREFLLQAERALRKEGGANAARDLLELCPKELRHFEWHHLYARAGRDGITLTGHRNRVRCAAFSPDRKMLATGSLDKSIILWDLTTRKARFTLSGHDHTVRAVAFHPSGKTLASASWDRTINLWNVATGKLLSTLPEHEYAIEDVIFSPDGAFLASHDSEEIRIFDHANSKPKAFLKEGKSPTTCIGFSTDGKHFAAGARDGSIVLWSVPEFRVVKAFAGHEHAVTGLAFLAGGKRLVSAARYEGGFQIWEAPEGKLLRTVVNSHKGTIHTIVANRDGTALAMISGENQGQVWHEPFEQPAHFFETLSVRSFVALHPDGVDLATEGANSIVKLFHFADHSAHIQTPEPVWAVQLGKDNQVLAAMRKDAAIFSLAADGTQRQTMLKGHRGTVRSIALQPQGELLATAGVDRLVKIWDAKRGAELHSLKGHARLIRSLAFSADGKQLASAGEDKTVKVWDPAAGKEVRTLGGHKGIVTSVAFLPGGLLASASGDGTIKIWNLATGKDVQTWRAHDDMVSYLTLSPDGTRLASAGNDGTVRIWDRATGETLHKLAASTGLVQSLAFSPDGKRLASGGGGVTLWDTVSGQAVFTFYGSAGQGGPVNVVSFSPDGMVLSSGSYDGTVQLWKGRMRE